MLKYNILELYLIYKSKLNNDGLWFIIPQSQTIKKYTNNLFWFQIENY